MRLSRLFLWDWFENLRAHDVGDLLSRRTLSRVGAWLDIQPGDLAVPISAVAALSVDADRTDGQYKVVVRLCDGARYASAPCTRAAAAALRQRLMQ